MATIALGCKAVIAVLLVAAGGAKLADLPGFAASVRLFAPRGTAPRLPRAIAPGIAIAEVAAGTASLSSPQAGWVNVVVLVLGCCFVAVSAAGYRWHRGRSCRCFGALSRRGFTVAGIWRAAAIAVAAAVAMVPVSGPPVQVGVAGRLALVAGALVVAVAAFSAAAAVGSGRDAQPGRGTRPRWDAGPGWAA